MFVKKFTLVVFVLVLFNFSTGPKVKGDLVTFTLDNVFFDTGMQMTGQFRWLYSAGDFENGEGEFLSLEIPYTNHDHSDLIITIETGQIEFSLDGSTHDDGVDITLSLLEPFNETSSVDLDLDANSSKYSIGGNGFHDGIFISGRITPAAIPEPTSVVFLYGLVVVSSIRRRRR